MADKITISALYAHVKAVLLSTQNLKEVYIGKTSSEESAKHRHQSEYDDTHVFVKGTPELISKAEDFFISNLKKDLKGIKVDNNNEGSGGSIEADKLYISWNVQYDNADQLFEPDFDSYEYILIEG